MLGSVVDAGDDEDQGRHRTDHHRVDKGLEESHDSLAHRIRSLGGGVSDRGGTDARLIRKRRTAEAHDQRTESPAVEGIPGERSG